jgi:hypothetical protein
MQAGSEQTNLDLTFPTLPAPSFSSQINVADISLFRIAEHSDTKETIVRRVSTILNGTVYFESLDGMERKLRPAEGIRFASSKGEIRTLDLDDSGLAVKFHGYVSGLDTGSDNERRSLMPTLLEWLRAQHGLLLLWGSALYLFTIAATVLRWWGVRL